MNKETKNNVLAMFAFTACIMLFSFQGRANDLDSSEFASAGETTISEPIPSESSAEMVEEDTTPVYVPSTEDSGDESLTFDE